MSELNRAQPQRNSFIGNMFCFALMSIAFCFSPEAFGQAQSNTPDLTVSRAQEHTQLVSTASLKELLNEAEQNNPQIRAARQGWQAAKQVPSQVSTLPDPQFQVQQFSVGSPRPFAGYTNSNFAYFGLGVSQDIPYPGKLRLRGEIAKRDADISEQQVESVRRSVLAAVKAVYFQLAYLSTTLGILDSDGALLKQVEQAAEARYRAGLGNQQDVIQAQLEQTKLLEEITHHHLEMGELEAELKQLLNQSQDSPDIEPSEPSETPLAQTYDELLAAAKVQNPDIAGAKKMVDKQALQVDLARKDFYPDFNIQYMWQRTDPTQYRAYYMLTLGVRLPIYLGRRQRPELAEAEADRLRATDEYEAQSQQVASELRAQYVTVQQTANLLTIYHEGLGPQSRAEFQAGLAAYQNNREDFQTLLAAFLDVLHLDEGYWQNVADYETAIARIEQLTGLSLRNEGAN
ncbi:MAG TPA: TolC family protein [Candidatus Acidoferrales bacterium]|jgi:outer membrane protein TolC|nr:TolC family protein [Candidatus Acidoferrales bacterium]